jgi:choline dehydrogenase-like flavoprotein
LNPQQREILRAFLAAQLDVLPTGYIDDLNEITSDAEAFLANTSPDTQSLIGLLLNTIRAESLGQFGNWTTKRRRDWLQKFSQRFPFPKQARDLIGTLASLGWLVMYSRPKGRRLVWPTEPGEPAVPVSVPEPARPDLVQKYAACVIGSGAGGAMVAARLAEAGVAPILIVESGPWIDPKNFPRRDDLALRHSYVYGGSQPALSHAIPVGEFLKHGRVGIINVLQANVIGGGPTVNNGICFRIPSPDDTPDSPFADWESADFPFTYYELAKTYTEIESELQLDPHTVDRVSGWRSSIFGPTGRRWRPLSIAVDNCLGCGGCNTGCRYGRKTGGLHGVREPGQPRSYLERALSAGAQIAVGLHADRFEIENGRAQRVLLRDLSAGKSLQVQADVFVLAAGPIASTAVLTRSALRLKPLGQRASANVTTAVYGVVPKHPAGPRNPGLQMCYFVGKEGKLLTETWFHYPGSIALTLPGWFGDHVRVIQDYEQLACIGVVVPTGPHGRINNGRLFLALKDDEFRRMKQGIIDAAGALFDAGAVKIHLASKEPISFDVADRSLIPQQLDEKVDEAADLKLATAHPQGGNAISKNSEISVVDETFRLPGLSDVYVADASLFPAGCGVNPMMTTLALAYMAADRIIRQLT